jgi:hypothetical protein
MPRVEDVLAGLAGRVAGGTAAEAAGALDGMLADAARKDLAALLSGALSAAGGAAPGGGSLRETGADTLSGHVRFTCRCAAPLPARRARERAGEKAGRKARRRKGGDFPRADGADAAFPLKKAAGLAGGMTPALAERLQKAAVTSGPFREGAALPGLPAGVRMTRDTFRRRALAAGARALAAQEHPPAWMPEPPLPAALPALTRPVPPTLYITLDGTGVPCVKKGTRGRRGKDGRPARTREIKVGVAGTYRRVDRRGRPVRDPGCGTHTASPEAAAGFGTLLRRLALSRGLGSGRFRVQIAGDGAEWIVNTVRACFPGADVTFACDFYHACEHLRAFPALAVPDAGGVRPAFERARSVLLRKDAAALLKHLLKTFAHLPADHAAWGRLDYFEKRKADMLCGKYRADGLYIGSGVVEAACRTDVARRCKRSGMHWRLMNAAAMCALCARYRSGNPVYKTAA